MSKILLLTSELKQINDIMNRLNLSDNPPDYVEIEVESINGIGKTTYMTIPQKINGLNGKFTFTITDENDW